MDKLVPATVVVLSLLTAAFQSASAAEPAGIREALAKYDALKDAEAVRLYGARPQPVDSTKYQFQYALVDLNDDGIQDAVVYMNGDHDCGSGGCTLRVLKGTGSGFVVVSGTLRVYPPISVLPSKVHGWKSLSIRLREGGAGILKFDGRRYPLAPPDGHRAQQSQLQEAKILIAGRSRDDGV